MTGTLYLCATPIGNLADITLRVLDTLKTVSLIACEDTRTSAKLLGHYEIRTPVTSYHKFNEKEKSGQLIGKLLEGEDIALITDAGTPVISDPGSILIAECQKQGIRVTSLPGPNAAVTALTLSGMEARRFIFEGFLPTDKKEKKEVLDSLKMETRTCIFYEAPHRLEKTLKTLYEALGDRKIALCRELTKKYESAEMRLLSEAIAFYETEEPRGEFVLVLAGRDPEEIKKESSSAWAGMTIPEHMQFYESQGTAHKDAMKLVAKDRGITKREVYQALL